MSTAEIAATPAPAGESFKDTRRAMARPRAEARGYVHRRRTVRVQLEPVMFHDGMAGDSLLRRLWDAHALKAGMVLFWGWFLLANWGRIAQQLAA